MKGLPPALLAATGAAESKVRQWRAGIVYAAVAGVLGVLSVVFLLVALTIALGNRFGIVGTCVVMGIIFALATALVIYLRHRAIRRAKLLAKLEARRAVVDSVAAGITSSPTAASLVALVAGYFLSRR